MSLVGTQVVISVTSTTKKKPSGCMWRCFFQPDLHYSSLLLFSENRKLTWVPSSNETLATATSQVHPRHLYASPAISQSCLIQKEKEVNKDYSLTSDSLVVQIYFIVLPKASTIYLFTIVIWLLWSNDVMSQIERKFQSTPITEFWLHIHTEWLPHV